MDIDKFFNEITASTKRIDSSLTGSITPGEIIPAIKKELANLNADSDYNPDSAKFKETEETTISDMFSDRQTQRRKTVLRGTKYREAGKSIHQCVRRIKNVVDEYVTLAEKKYGPDRDKSNTTMSNKNARKCLSESRNLSVLTGKYVSTVIKKTAAALRLARIYVREFNPEFVLGGHNVIKI